MWLYQTELKDEHFNSDIEIPALGTEDVLFLLFSFALDNFQTLAQRKQVFPCKCSDVMTAQYLTQVLHLFYFHC